MQIFKYSRLVKELKAQTDIAKEQYKLLRYQKNNVIDNNRVDGENRKEKKEW